MMSTEQVGLLLGNDEERQLLREVARDCGLQPFDLSREMLKLLFGQAVAAGCEVPLPIEGAVRWIVLDNESAFPECLTPAAGKSLSIDLIPLMILVRDARSAVAGDDEAAEDPEYVFVLLRPLSRDVVSACLRQAIRVGRVFAERNYRIVEELRQARRIFDSVCNGISVADARLPDLPLVYVNPAFEKMTGYTAAEVCGRNCRFLQGGNESDSNQDGLTAIREAIRGEHDAHALLRNYRRDGTGFWNELYLSPIFNSEGVLTHFVGIQNDVTGLVEASNRLDYLAHHDVLTGLANRGLLMERLNQTLARARRSGRKAAVLFFDLDNFKHVNDVFGHDAGDILLKVVAGRLNEGTRSFDAVARLGGDEFIVMIEEISGDRTPDRVVQRLLGALNEPIDILGGKFHVSASVGTAIFPEDGETGEALIKVADFRMYSAKHEGRRAEQAAEAIADHEREK